MGDALFDGREIDLLRTALEVYTVDSVHELLGLPGQAALQRGDLAGVARRVSGDDRLPTLVRLFLLGADVAEAAARAALAPLPLEVACGAGLVAASAGSVRALLDLRPYAEATNSPPGAPGSTSAWWVVSDFGADVRGGPLAPDHVLGIGSASLTLAQATPRQPVERALDIGTGCGIQALHLARHSVEVVATDVSTRALRLAATSAALSGQSWDLRAGSLLEPVGGEKFDLIVANPPFVVSGGTGGYDYRDSGCAGDGVSEALVRQLPGALWPGGTAQLLANWVITAEQSWDERLHGWLAGSGCDAWAWQREVAEPGEYVSLWLRDAGELPGTPRWSELYNAWLDWFDGAKIAAVGMGLITMWRDGAAEPVVICEDVPQPFDAPVGPELPKWIARQRWLRATPADELLASVLGPAPGLVRDRADLLGPNGWVEASARLRQTHGLRWEVEVDEAIAAIIAGCDATTPLNRLVAVLAAALDRPLDEVGAAVVPVVRDLVGRGFLIPAGLS